MKLYYKPGACSLSPHIVAEELGLSLTLEAVDLRSKTLASGGDYLAVNPKGYVPALALDEGQLLTEVPAIVQYLADLRPMGGLAPANGSFERYRLQEWLSYINGEVHKQFGRLFVPNAPAEVREAALALIAKRLQLIDDTLARQPYLLGEAYSVADIYLYVVLSWAPGLKIDLSAWPSIQAYLAKIGTRPAVRVARQKEGLPA
jgi:glutathione S-transferase